MTVFDSHSRYRDSGQYQVPDARGRIVTVVSVPAAPEQVFLGWHVWREGERPDHLASRYLDDAAGYWRIAEQNGAMHAEWLSEQSEIAIPKRGS